MRFMLVAEDREAAAESEIPAQTISEIFKY